MKIMAPTGYWGQQTSTTDWCEENYQITWYIAEFWNTISNIFMIIPGLYGTYDAITQGFQIRFILLNLSLLACGIGSTLFHMTLKWEGQLLDELPMVWGSLLTIYTLLKMTGDSKNMETFYKLALVAYGILFTVTYLTLKHPLIVQVMYGFLVIVVLILDCKTIANYRTNKHLVKLVTFGLPLYIGGFLSWIVDNLLCRDVQIVRSRVHYMAQPFTQLHSYWHLAGGYGSYLQVLFCLCHHQYLMKKPVELKHYWMGIRIQTKIEK